MILEKGLTFKPIAAAATAPLVFIDIETTGVDFNRHEVTEVSFIRREIDGRETSVEMLMQAQRLDLADVGALKLQHYYERRDPIIKPEPEEMRVTLWSRAQVAATVARWTAGSFLVGISLAFDWRFLHDLIVAEGLQPAWDFHLIDVNNFAAGRLGWGHPPWHTSKVCEALGVDKDAPEFLPAHAALQDARLSMAIYDATRSREVTR